MPGAHVNQEKRSECTNSWYYWELHYYTCSECGSVVEKEESTGYITGLHKNRDENDMPENPFIYCPFCGVKWSYYTVENDRTRAKAKAKHVWEKTINVDQRKGKVQLQREKVLGR